MEETVPLSSSEFNSQPRLPPRSIRRESDQKLRYCSGGARGWRDLLDSQSLRLCVASDASRIKNSDIVQGGARGWRDLLDSQSLRLCLASGVSRIKNSDIVQGWLHGWRDRT